MCDCMSDLNNRLAEHGVKIAPAINFFTGNAVPVIVTEKLPGKRGKGPVLVASHCPFCGTPYPKAKSEAP